MYKIGIVGMGFVGKAIFHGFSLFYETKGYDIDPKKSSHSLDEVLNSDFVFVCLPTPSSKNGEADLSYIFQFFENVKNKKPIFILKSTVPIGTTQKLKEIFSIKILHNPEFLSARTADVDFLTQSRVILGGDDKELLSKVGSLFSERFHGINIVEMNSNESETVKYFLNCFFATKITFFNEMKLLVDTMKLDWNSVMKGVLSDGRIEKLHTDVPGHDGKLGFGGACFPKDTLALSKIFKKNDLDPVVLDAVIKQNKNLRNEFE